MTPIIEKSLRFSIPHLYEEMVNIFSEYNIHPYDFRAKVMKKKEGYEMILYFSESYSQTAKTEITSAQVKQPDDQVKKFFHETAEKCKNQLISDYFKMIKV